MQAFITLMLFLMSIVGFGSGFGIFAWGVSHTPSILGSTGMGLGLAFIVLSAILFMVLLEDITTLLKRFLQSLGNNDDRSHK